MNLNAIKRTGPISRPHLLTYNLTPTQLAGIADSFSIWQLERKADTFKVLDPTENQEVSFLNQAILFVLFSTETGLDGEATQLVEWCQDNAVMAPVIDFDSISPELLWSLASHMMDNYRQASSVLKQLSILREVHEELQNSYDEIRTFVADEGLLTPKVGFCNEPQLDIALTNNAHVIHQAIPTELRRLAGFSLFNQADVPPDASGSVKVELFSTSDDRVGYTWKRNAGCFKKGWVTFAFDKRKGSFLRRNVAVRVTFEPNSAQRPQFAFGMMQVPASKAAVVDGSVQPYALALRTWISLSGAPLTVSTQMWPTIRADGIPITRLELTIDGNLEVQDVLQLGEKLDFRPILWDQNRRWIFVHPLDHSPTIARLSDVCPRGTTRIVAEVETVHPQAGPVEYGIALSSDEDDRVVLPLSWTRLAPEVSSEIILELDRPLGRAHSLLLFTRIEEYGIADYCWAHFKRVYFEGEF